MISPLTHLGITLACNSIVQVFLLWRTGLVRSHIRITIALFEANLLPIVRYPIY